jgi:hypothetical protein
VRSLIVTALAVGIWITPFAQRTEKGDATTKADKTAKGNQGEQSAESKAKGSIEANLAKIQQQQAQTLQAIESRNKEDLATQRELVKYTKWLVYVGVLQGFVFFLTLLAIRHEASIAGDIASAAKDNAAAASDNAIAVKDGAKAAEANARASEASAEAAKESVEIIVRKERARIKIRPIELVLTPHKTLLANVTYEVLFYGSTPAFIADAHAEAYVSDSLAPSSTSNSLSFPMSLPEVITPLAPLKEQTTFIGPKWTLEQVDIDRLNDGTLFIHFNGFIQYKDVFDRERETRFRYVWKTSNQVMPDGKRFAYWMKVGPSGDNTET